MQIDVSFQEQIKMKRMLSLTTSEYEARLLIKAIQNTFGQWDDKRFNWISAAAERINKELCAYLNLDPEKREHDQL